MDIAALREVILQFNDQNEPIESRLSMVVHGVAMLQEACLAIIQGNADEAMLRDRLETARRILAAASDLFEGNLARGAETMRVFLNRQALLTDQLLAELH